jgi:L-iditol 2-dehydrogenase
MLAIGQTRFKDPVLLTLPEPGNLREGEIRVRMSLSPIGVAEVRALEGHRLKLVDQIVDEDHPFIFGFAGVGTIDDPGQSDLQPGQRVLVAPYNSCGECAACLAEDEIECPNPNGLSGIDVHTPGLMREYVVVRSQWVLPLPEGISDEEGCYVSEAATAVHLLRRVKLKPDQTVAVVGCGRHGQQTILVAKAMGAKNVLGLDPSSVSREAALACGADEVIEAPDCRTGYDVVIHCNSFLETLGTCCDLARVGGTIGLLGTPEMDHPNAEIKEFTRRVLETERLLVASRSKGMASFRIAINLMKDGMPLKINNSQTVSMSQAPRQFMKTLAEWPGGRPTFIDLRIGE